MMIEPDLLYTEEHEWIRLSEATGVIGITHYAQEQLGDVVYVELPEVGAEFSAGEAFGVIESVKSVSDLYIPVSGRITKVNDRLIDNPELINEDPYRGGWIVEIELSDPSETSDLLSAEQYQTKVGE